MNRCLKFVIAFSLLLGSFCEAQVPHFQTYYLLRKNEPVQVNVIFQDRAGLIWTGTNKGLFRFDGLQLTRFTLADSLPDENVTALGEDTTGRLWMGYKNGRITFMDNGIVQAFETPEGSATGQISDLLFDKKGHLWFSTLNDGLYYFVNDRLFRLDEQEGLPDLYIYDLAEDDEGRVWAGTDGGIAICTLDSAKASIQVINQKSGLPDNIIKKVVATSGGMWLGTEDAGVLYFDRQSGSIKPLQNTPWEFGSIKDFLLEDSQLWISTLAGLVVYDRKTASTQLYNTSAASINVLLRDAEGNIWCGSKTGLMRTLGDQLEYNESFDGSKDANVIALTIDRKNRLWFSNNEGLFRRTVEGPGKVKTERMLLNTVHQNQTVISLYTDTTGFVWAGLYGEGVLRINPDNDKLDYLNQELRNGNILSIAGKGDVLWLATLGGGSKIVTTGGKLQVTNYGSSDGLSTDYIYQVYIDSKDRVWFATDGKGVDMLDAAGFHHYQNGLNSKVVYGFAEDAGKDVWINVQGDGLYEFDDNGFVSASKRFKLRDNNINAFASDPGGRLVVMHDLGIDVVDTRTNKVRYLIDELGLRDKKANLNAAAKDAAGVIFFGTDAGIVRYKSRQSTVVPGPRPLIRGMKVFDQNRPIVNNMEFRHDENDITISYLGVWFQNPQNLSYQYLLENYDRDWISSRDHSVTYSSLPPGNYTFHLKVSETDDFSDAPETKFTFSITPPFWKTIWFYTMCASSFGIVAYYFIRYRERRLLEDNRILEERVKERTLEIQQKTDEIQAQNEEIQAQAETMRDINENLESLVSDRTSELERKNKSLEEYAFINAHELRAPVASILGLINLMKTVELEEHEKVYLEHLQKSADRLESVCTAITQAIEKGD